VRLTVTNPHGESDVAETQVVVTDPDVHFASTTWCFANAGTPGGSGFEACPTQTHVAPRRDRCERERRLRSRARHRPLQRRAGQNRCLFRAGDTFRSSGC
jgi:hypothetical protein